MKAVILALIATCGLLLAGCGERASDQRLAERLAEHRVSFERIVTLFEETPGLGDVDREERGSLDPPADPAAAEAARLVRGLLERTGLARVVRDRLSGGLLFVAEEAGIGISGATKGLLHAPALPEALRERLVEDTEAAFEAARARQEEGEGLDLTLLRRIEGAWYVLLETY